MHIDLVVLVCIDYRADWGQAMSETAWVQRTQAGRYVLHIRSYWPARDYVKVYMAIADATILPSNSAQEPEDSEAPPSYSPLEKLSPDSLFRSRFRPSVKDIYNIKVVTMRIVNNPWDRPIKIISSTRIGGNPRDEVPGSGVPLRMNVFCRPPSARREQPQTVRVYMACPTRGCSEMESNSKAQPRV